MCVICTPASLHSAWRCIQVETLKDNLRAVRDDAVHAGGMPTVSPLLGTQPPQRRSNVVSFAGNGGVRTSGSMAQRQVSISEAGSSPFHTAPPNNAPHSPGNMRVSLGGTAAAATAVDTRKFATWDVIKHNENITAQKMSSMR